MSDYKDTRYRQAKPREKMYKLSDGKGLSLHVMPNGSKYWRYKYRMAGKEKLFAIGVYPEVTLSKARAAHKEARGLVMAGIDPATQKRLEKAERKVRAANSFEAVAREWFQKSKGEWQPRHAERVMNWLERDFFPDLGNRPISEIKPAELLPVIKKIEKHGADTARRQRGRCEHIFRYAIQTSRAEYNPAVDMKGVIKSQKQGHRPAMKRDGLGPFLRQLDTFDRITEVTRLGLRLLVLTFVRPGELRGARWEEFDLDHKEWRIPAERMKMRAEHVVPLSQQALDVIEELRPLTERSEYLFPNDRTRSRAMSENALSYAMGRMGYKGIATPHGFRATASTILNETGFKPDVIEKQLAHVERNKVRAAYHRAEYMHDRRKMMTWWATYLDGLKDGADVISVHKSMEI